MPPNAAADERYGYTVSRSFVVKVRAIGQAGAIERCVHRGGRHGDQRRSISGSRIRLPRAPRQSPEPSPTRGETPMRVARAAGLHIVSIKSIEYGGRPGVEPLMIARVSAAPTQFDQSNVNVTVSLSVVFLAQP